MLRALWLLSCTSVVFTLAKVPKQWFYSPDNAASSGQAVGGCTITRWNGTDPNGISGYPFLSTIDCPARHTFEDFGVTITGMLRFYLRSGQMQVPTHQRPNLRRTQRMDPGEWGAHHRARLIILGEPRDTRQTQGIWVCLCSGQ